MITHHADTAFKDPSTQQNTSPFTGLFKRALLVAAVLGSVLTLINQSNAVFGNGAFQYDRVALVFLTPFIVVSVSQLLAIRRALADARSIAGFGGPEERLLSTALRHGIPVRAAIVSLIMGSLAAGYAVLSAGADSVGAGDFPVALMAQGYVLPALFGVLSQTISYRRVARSLSR